jgi:hypothetical protein
MAEAEARALADLIVGRVRELRSCPARRWFGLD